MNTQFQLTPEEKDSIRKFLVAKMKTMTPDQYAYWSMDQDGWEDDLEEVLGDDRFQAMAEESEELGEFPLPSVGEFLAELEVEAYGRVVCE